MTRDRFQRVKQLVQQALDLPESERPAFLDRACGGDAELRAEVEALLDQPTAGLADATVDVTTMMQGGPDRDAGPGREIGPYRLLEKIGEGGMGEVWVAEQSEPVKRRVALKVIKRGMDSDQIVARFEAERQALALMDHPSIAKVFDGGQTPEGRPYFVMEHVDGVPITEHCDRHKLSTQERLELFARSARACNTRIRRR